jgi:pimeloyl-ACP methyl ester carboxylesterase
MSFYNLHPNKTINFQFNRLTGYGEIACRLEEVKEIAYRTSNFDAWFLEWTALAIKAKREGRLLHAAYAYRMAEFFLPESSPDKRSAYQNFRECFYAAFPAGEIEIDSVPYEGHGMPVIRIKAKEEKGIILVHGGYDSFMEEFFVTIKDIAARGYTIIMFDGPGQGFCLYDGLKMTPEWERPVRAVLDHYQLDDVTLLGISLGGFLAARAAAFDTRIKRLVCYDVCYNFFDAIVRWMPPTVLACFRLAFKLQWQSAVDGLMHYLMKKNMGIAWLVRHGMFITGTRSPYEYYREISRYSIEEVAPRIRQHCLLLAGEADHYIPISHIDLCKKAFTNAASLRLRVFTKAEGGEQHCQLGNHHLAVEEILDWLANLSKERQ